MTRHNLVRRIFKILREAPACEILRMPAIFEVNEMELSVKLMHMVLQSAVLLGSATVSSTTGQCYC